MISRKSFGPCSDLECEGTRIYGHAYGKDYIYERNCGCVHAIFNAKSVNALCTVVNNSNTTPFLGLKVFHRCSDDQVNDQ